MWTFHVDLSFRLMPLFIWRATLNEPQPRRAQRDNQAVRGSNEGAASGRLTS